MAYTDWDALQADITNPKLLTAYVKRGAVNGKGLLYSGWAHTPNALAAPTTAAVCTSASAPMPGIPNASGQRSLVHCEIGTSSSWRNNDASLGGGFVLVDRLSHQGGLVGNVATLQTTNLPTAALTRYTSGVGVWALLEGYTAWSNAMATTATIKYTNQAGTGNQSGIVKLDGVISYPAAGSAIRIGLASGDTGVRSVESIQISSAGATAGNAGITLVKPLAMLTSNLVNHHDIRTIVGGLQEVLDDACLQILFFPSFNTQTAGITVSACLAFGEC